VETFMLEKAESYYTQDHHLFDYICLCCYSVINQKGDVRYLNFIFNDYTHLNVSLDDKYNPDIW